MAASSVGMIVVAPPAAANRAATAATVAGGECPAIARGVAQTEVDELVPVEIDDAVARCCVEEQREAASCLRHPRHRHAAEQVGCTRRIGPAARERGLRAVNVARSSEGCT